MLGGIATGGSGGLNKLGPATSGYPRPQRHRGKNCAVEQGSVDEKLREQRE